MWHIGKMAFTSCFQKHSIVILFCSFTGANAHALTLESYLEVVKKNNSAVRASELLEEVAQMKRGSGDYVELSPYLIAQATYFDDKKEQMFPTQQGTRTKIPSFSVGINKKLSTGTTLGVALEQSKKDIEGIAFPYVVSWDSTIKIFAQQSLWKNIFGRGTSYRHERESAQEKMERLNQRIQGIGVLVQAELSYWEWFFREEEYKEKKEGIDRAQKLRDWTAKRLANGIGDRSDLLQVESLLKIRELDFIGANDSLLASRRLLLDFGQDDALPINTAERKTTELEFERDPHHLVQDWKKAENSKTFKIVKLESELIFTASQLALSAEGEGQEMLKPDLTLEGSYATNSREVTYGDSLGASVNSNTPTAAVGLKFTMNFDFFQKQRLLKAAKIESIVSKMKSEKSELDSRSAWSELERRHKELSRRIKVAEELSRFQDEKFKRERERIAVGRSTTFQVVTFEQDAAEARLNLLRLKAEQRKLEASARLFIVSEGNV